MSNKNDFVIINRELTKYKGYGGDVIIPDGVTNIGENAFSGCKGLTSITIPQGVTSIGDKAFSGCTGLTSVIIPDGVIYIDNWAFDHCSGLTSVTIPESVTNIGSQAFEGCSGLTSVTIPEGVTSISYGAFDDCSGLTDITIPESVTSIGYKAFWGCSSLISFEMNNCKAKLVSDVFGNSFPKGLIHQIPTLYPHMADGALKQYVLKKETWNCLGDEMQAKIFLARQSNMLEKTYVQCVDSEQLEQLGNAVLECLNGAKPTAKECNAAAAYMTMFHDKAHAAILNQLYSKLKECKNGAKALKTVEAHVALMEKLGSKVTVDENLSPFAQKVMSAMIAEKKNAGDVEKELKSLYNLTLIDLPVLKSTDGKELEPFAAAWLLTAHEKLEENSWEQPYVIAAYEKEGLRPEVTEIVAMLDQKSLQAALLKLADGNLGLSGRSKKMFLAYPICRYADEDLMIELTKRAPKWRSSISGNDAPPLATFRKAVMYSNARAAMFFAERYNELGKYAAVRGMTEDDIRDKYLSDVGLDEKGGKEYDLGNQVVTVRLQDDLSFLVELPSGKTAKSLPKKGADPEKYEAATKSFTEVKRYIKRILNHRGEVLFEDFLSGKARSSEDWQNSYLHNPLLRKAANLVVWSQGKNTFTLKDGAPIDSAERPYTITENDIVVAHPMEIEAEDTKAWQKYFTAHGLKQPFVQIWEPVRKAEEIKEDRYKDCRINPLYLKNKKKMGIKCKWYYESHFLGIEGFDVDVQGAPYVEGDKTERLEITSLRPKTWNRRASSVIVYLDRITVWDRVRKDDISVMDQMPGFTLAQITEFIAAAQEANAVNVLAALLEYKNTTFADFDPMDEFTLEW